MSDEKRSGWGEFWVTFICLLIVFGVGIGLGISIKNQSYKQAAVEAGVGRFVITDTNNGGTTFEFFRYTNTVYVTNKVFVEKY